MLVTMKILKDKKVVMKMNLSLTKTHKSCILQTDGKRIPYLDVPKNKKIVRNNHHGKMTILLMLLK